MTDIAVASATAPVFVDPGGHRRRVLTAVGVGGALLLVTYLLVVIAALTGARWVPAIGLPGVDAPAAVVPTPDAIASAGLIGRVTDVATSEAAAVGDDGSAADPSSPVVTTPLAVTPPDGSPPVTAPPAAPPPVTSPPVTSPPVTEPPVTEPPVTSPPATSPPGDPDPPTTLPPQTDDTSTDSASAAGRGRSDGVGAGNGRVTAHTTG